MSVLNIVGSTQLTSKELCSVALSCTEIDNPIYTWNISLPDVPKPTIKRLELPRVFNRTNIEIKVYHRNFDFVFETLF